MILCDLFGGLIGAEGVLMGLYRRERTGRASEVRSSLLAGAMALQAHVLEGLARGKEDGRRDGRPLWGVLDRPIATTDGMLVVSAEDDDSFRRLCALCGEDPGGAPRGSAEARLASRLGRGTAAQWEARLVDAGIAAARVSEDLAAVPSDPRLSELFEPVDPEGLAPRSPWSFA
jgi:crotonobetainyl-CoA:carnitine CoA-transferase CaiB-like acyl-CoA transferase